MAVGRPFRRGTIAGVLFPASLNGPDPCATTLTSRVSPTRASGKNFPGNRVRLRGSGSRTMERQQNRIRSSTGARRMAGHGACVGGHDTSRGGADSVRPLHVVAGTDSGRIARFDSPAFTRNRRDGGDRTGAIHKRCSRCATARGQTIRRERSGVPREAVAGLPGQGELWACGIA